MIDFSSALRPSALYVVVQRGCAACEAAEPDLAAFASAHPGQIVLRLDASGPLPGRLGIRVRATPTYLWRTPDGEKIHEGSLTTKELERFTSEPVEAEE